MRPKPETSDASAPDVVVIALVRRVTDPSQTLPTRPRASKGASMTREAEKYRAYERECLRQARQAHSSERRIKLFELARVWADAALAVEVDKATGDVLSPSSRPAKRTRSSG